MSNSEKSKVQLTSELESMRKHAAELEARAGRGGGEREPAERDERFLRVLDTSLMGIFIHEEYRLLYVNQAFSSMMGYGSPEELVAHGDLASLRAEDERERLRGYYDARKLGRQVNQRYEYRGLRKDGQTIWLEQFIQAVEWQGRQAIMGSVVDISDRKHAEVELNRFKTTLDMTADCVFMFDPDTLRFFYVNQGAIDQVEYSQEELLDMTPLGIKPEFDEKSFRKILSPMRSGKNPSHKFETIHRTKSGTDIPVEVFLQYISPESEETRFVAIVRDITERRNALEEVRASQRLLKTVFDVVPNFVSMKDRQGRFQMVNQAFAQSFNYDPEQLVGKTLGEVTGFEDSILQISNESERLIIESGRPAEPRKERLTLPGGRERIGYVHKLPISDDSGKITGIVTINLDITELEAAEEASRQSEERFRAIAHATPYAIAVVALESGEFLYMNEPYKELFQIEEEEQGSIRAQEIYVNPTDREEFVNIIKREGKLQHFELEMKKRNGERFWAVLSSVEMNYNGVRSIITGLIDVTGQKQAAEELRQSEERFRAIAHATPYPIALIELDSGKFIYSNEPFKELFQVKDRDPSSYVAQDFYVDAADREKIVETVKREGRIQLVEREMKKGTGEHFWAVSSSVELEYEDRQCVITGLVDITERIHAAEELRASQRLLQTIFNTVPNWLYTKDAEGRYQMVNRSMAEFFNLQPRDFVGKSIDEIVTEEGGAASALQSDKDVVRLNTMVNLPDATVVAPDGSIRNRHIVKLPLRDDDGNVIGMVGASEDVTERKATEKALRESEARLSDAIESIADGFALYDTDDRLVVFNQRFTETYPNRADALVAGLRFEDMLRDAVGRGEFAGAAGREEEWIAERVRRHANPEGPFEQELADGRWLRIEERRTSQGGIVGLRTDITHLKEVEEALRMSEERFRTTLDHSPSAITLKGLDGRFQLSNRRFASLIGMTVEEVIGKTLHDLFPKHEADLIGRQDKQVMETGAVIESEQEITLPGGSTYACLMARFPVTGADGELQGVGTISTDISEQKKIEQQLRESQKLEAVGQLAGGIAHDFNNMLQVIINRALFARDGLPPADPLDEHLSAIVEAGQHAADLTRQLLAYSRKSVIKAVPLNLNDLTTTMIRMMGRIFGEQIELEFRPGHSLSYVKADPGMLEQVILNLCVNARDALPKGGRILIEAQNFHADANYCTRRGWGNPGDYVMLAVQDNGVGMSPDIQERVFEPFFTSKEMGKGTGLGLAMVYGIIRQHDGQLEVESTPGKGSTFKIFLPTMDHTEAEESQLPLTEIPSGSETILVVEDQPSVRDIISRMLTGKGYQVLTACDGEEAVSVFKDHADRISLVVLDMVLPKMSGLETLEHIREIRSDAAVLFSTGYSPDSADKDLLGGNGPRLIQKPYAPRELLETVREMIDQQLETHPG